MFASIDVIELKDILKDINIIDIRTYNSYQEDHIPGSINIPYEELLIRPEKYLNQSQSYYIYCDYGMKSRSLCQIVGKKYDLINIAGGYQAWKMRKD